MFDLFNQPSILQGKQLRDIGMHQASSHAEKICEAWNEKAYRLLVKFISCNNEFTCEQFRSWAENQIETPPSLRAYGGIINRAAHNQLIEQDGTVKVTNPKAHRANAALWRRKQIEVKN